MTAFVLMVFTVGAPVALAAFFRVQVPGILISPLFGFTTFLFWYLWASVINEWIKKGG